MRLIYEDILPNQADKSAYPIYQITDDPEDLLFVDIETTGLSARSSSLYMIGCAFYENKGWHLRQWFADQEGEGKTLLVAFLQFAEKYHTLLHFNGNRFDLPYLKTKCEKYGVSYPFDEYESIDLYKKIAPYKKVLSLPDCKQKTIEGFLGIEREDKYNGGQLIELYEKYISEPSEDLYRTLTQHNADDIRGMFQLLPILWFDDFFSELADCPNLHMRTDSVQSESSVPLPLRAVKVQANYYKDLGGTERQEILMKLALPFKLPATFCCKKDEIYFQADGESATLRVPLVDDELKYFYTNYKDYFYLPEEDQAIHKSVAAFVDRKHKEPAKAENCYTRKPGQYLQEWDLVFTPFFKHEYKEHAMYFELTDYIKKNRSAMSLYACHTLQYLFSSL